MRRWIPQLVGALAGLAVTLPVGLLFYDLTVPIVSVQSVSLGRAEVTPGDALQVTYEYTRYRNCRSTVYQWVFDARARQYAVQPYAVEGRPLGSDRITMNVPVPGDAAPGAARYQVVVRFDCPLLWWESRHTVVSPYVPFSVLPSPGSG